MGVGNEIILPNLGMVLYSDEHSLEDWGLVSDLRQARREAFSKLHGSLRGYEEPSFLPQTMHYCARREGRTHHIIACQHFDDRKVCGNRGRAETYVLHAVEGLEKLERRLCGLGAPMCLDEYSSTLLCTPQERDFIADIGGLSVLHECGFDILGIDPFAVPPEMRDALLLYQGALVMRYTVH